MRIGLRSKENLIFVGLTNLRNTNVNPKKEADISNKNRLHIYKSDMCGFPDKFTGYHKSWQLPQVTPFMIQIY